MDKERKTWIDVAKLIAMLAVMLDHTYLNLYSDGRIWYATFFSVGMFILMMGITTFCSLKNCEGNVTGWLVKRVKGLMGPYLFATMVYVVFYNGFFDLELYIEHVIHFDSVILFYYVLLYLQLVIISPLIYRIFCIAENKKYGVVIEITGFVFVVFVSFITMNYTNILSVFGGGGKLFGGTYLILLYVGMWFGKYHERIWLKIWLAALLFVVGLVGSVSSWMFIVNNQFMLDKKIPLGSGINPPSISLLVYTLLLAVSVWALGMLLSGFANSIPTKIFNAVAKLGKHTLYMFLYHAFVLELLSKFFKSTVGIGLDNIWLKRVIYFPCMILGSLLIERVLKKGYQLLKKCYKSE